MKYKMVACDCDNTLIATDGCLPKDNITAIRKIMNMDVEFVIASGRNDLLLTDITGEIGGQINLIGCNGATIRNLEKGIVYRNEPIPKPALKYAIDYFNAHNIDFKAYTLEAAFSKGLDLGDKLERLTGVGYKKAKDFDTEYVTDTDFIKELDVLKLVVVDEHRIVRKIQEELKHTEGINGVLAADVCLDFISHKATKGSALLCLAEKMGIKPEEIIAFGDTENDISMLKAAGLSVCMGNGTDEVKRICNTVTKTNDEAGVAYMLNNVFGLNMY